MADTHKGLITDAGFKLFGDAQSGDSQIKYTKVVFSSDKGLLDKDDDDIRQLTDVDEKQLSTTPVAFNNGLVAGKNNVKAYEVDVRAVMDNQNVGKNGGFYPYVSALYAADASGNEVLYGVILDDKPGYVPPFDGFTPQPLVFNWRLYTASTDDFSLAQGSDVYATIADLNGYDNKIKEIGTQVSDIGAKVDDLISGGSNAESFASNAVQNSNVMNIFASAAESTNDDNDLVDLFAGLRGKPTSKPAISARMGVSNGAVNYRITPPKWDGGTGIRSYKVFWQPSTSNNDQWNEIDQDGDQLTGEVDKLNYNEKYNFKVIAVNAFGDGPESDTIQTTIGNPPSAPQISAKMRENSTELDFTITPPSDHGTTAITSYEVFYRKTGTDDDWAEYDTDNLNDSIKNLDKNTKYDIYATASNEAGPGAASDTGITSVGNPPAAPTVNAQMNTSNGTIKYTISAPINGGTTAITQYNIYYSVHGQNDYSTVDVKPNELTGTLPNLNPKQQYDIYATATNDTGEGQASSVVTTNLIDSNIYGVHWNRSSDVHLDRTDSAIGLVAGINGERDDFDNVGPWNLFKRVTDDKGNVFVRIPKFYIYKEQDGSENNGNLYIKVSLVDHGQGWYLPKCFWDFENHQELPYVDVGAYDATVNNSQLQSITGATPTASTSMDTFRQYARNMGYGYGILDIHTIDAITCLFLVEFATLDSKSVMEGKDESNSGSMVNNGATDNHKGSSGTDSGNRNGTMNYRGIENLWGNVWQWIDGVNLNGGPIWICDDQSQYQSNVYANPYKQLDYNTSGNGDMSSIGLDTNNPEANFATATNGSATTYFCDSCNVDYSGYVPYFGGGYDYSADNVGLFDWSDGTSSGSYDDIGSRLIKKDIG